MRLTAPFSTKTTLRGCSSARERDTSSTAGSQRMGDEGLCGAPQTVEEVVWPKKRLLLGQLDEAQGMMSIRASRPERPKSAGILRRQNRMAIRSAPYPGAYSVR